MNGINIDSLDGLHLPPPSEHKLLSPLPTPFSQDEFEDDDDEISSDFAVSHHMTHHMRHNDDEDDED